MTTLNAVSTPAPWAVESSSTVRVSLEDERPFLRGDSLSLTLPASNTHADKLPLLSLSVEAPAPGLTAGLETHDLHHTGPQARDVQFGFGGLTNGTGPQAKQSGESWKQHQLSGLELSFLAGSTDAFYHMRMGCRVFLHCFFGCVLCLLDLQLQLR